MIKKMGIRLLLHRLGTSSATPARGHPGRPGAARPPSSLCVAMRITDVDPMIST
jgi:hypothetical protein